MIFVEHACIGHDAEEQDGEDEQHRRAVDAGHTGLDKAGHIIQRKGAGGHQDDGGDGGDADESQCRDCDIAQQQQDNGDDRSEAQQREDSFTHDWYFLSFYPRFYGMRSIPQSLLCSFRF